MKEDSSNIRTLWTFFDYTVTNHRKYINTASTLQIYWNVWALLRRENVDLSIPGFIKDKMTGLALIILLAGRERPYMVLEVQPDKTKRYRGRKKQNPTLGIPEVPSEPCLLLCPKTLFLGLLLRKSAFLHLHITSAEQLYALRVPPDAGSLPLCPCDPEAFLFDISARTLNAWLKRLGELVGFDLSITLYWLRRGAGEAVNSSYRYAPDYFPKDFSAVWRGRKPQDDIIRMASGQGRSINLRRPIDLNEAQEADADSQPDVQRCKAQWQQAKQKMLIVYGTMSNGKGIPLFEEAMKKRNTYHTARQAARRAMKEAIRVKFNKEQPVEDIIRQVHGLSLDSSNKREAAPVPPA
ncbi:hypothetical protein FE257_005666 [Aspergillus nanangensis]|uniref:Uncharacterized protein n=1 Tax=Aspergillus nanangensis TaxID=2582783 RepID=A0AAD4CA39_ASPNN|nr:hypothetical protein FE257_005666 [Aspergillus nanangensis]